MTVEELPKPENPNQKQRVRVFLTPKRVLLGVVVVVILVLVVGGVVQVTLDPPLKNESGMRGTFEIDVDRDVEVYIGNELIGTGAVKVTWDDLLGPSRRPPLAIPIDTDAPSPGDKGLGAISAESISGEGSEIAWTRNGMSGHGQFLGGPFTFA